MANAKAKNIALWIGQIVLGAFYIMQSIPKLTSDAEVIANFQRWGMPGGFHYVVGGVELFGGLLLCFRPTAAFSALGLILLMMGAAVTHLIHGDGAMVLLPLVPLLLLAVIAYYRRPGAANPGILAGAARTKNDA